MAYSRVLQGCLLPLFAALLTGGCGGGGSGASQPPPCAADTKTCFVRASGSDGNSGADPAHALQTISRASTLALDGYTIIVGPGTYNEGVTTAAVGVAPRGLWFIADPTGSNTTDVRGPVIVDARNSAQKAGFNLYSSGCLTSPPRCGVIDGFEVTGGADAGIVIKSGSDQFSIQNCIVRDNAGDGIRVQDSANVLVFNNLAYDNGICSLQCSGGSKPGASCSGDGDCPGGNCATACNGGGILMTGTPNGSGSPEARIYNNTVFRNADHGIIIGTTKVASPGASVVNNIVEDNNLPASNINIKVVSGHPSASNDSVFGYSAGCNIVYPATYDPANGIRGTHDFAGDALFVNPPTDFHLMPGSPAIDASDPSSCALSLPNSQATILKSRTTAGTNASPGPPDGGQLDLGFHFLRQRLS